MEITKAIIEDVPALCVLINSLFIQEAEFKPNHEVQARSLVAVINDSEIGDIIVAREGGKIIGMVSILYTVSTALGGRVALFEDMIVSSEVRGAGVGSKLIERSIEFAKEKGCKRITLLTDYDNERAHRFYQRHGFNRSSMVAFRRLLDGDQNV